MLNKLVIKMKKGKPVLCRRSRTDTVETLLLGNNLCFLGQLQKN